MNLIYNVSQVMHRIRVKMYPNYLPGYENTFIARTDSEAVLSVDQVCAAMRDRGGFKGNVDDLIENVKKFLEESAYQLCDGFAVNNGFYTIYPNIGGIFKRPHDTPDPAINPLTFRFRALPPLRKMAEAISITSDGPADTAGYIDEFIDKDLNASNSAFVPEHGFVIFGDKIKIAGEDPGVGMFFVPIDDPSKAVKVTRIFENVPSKIIGICPNTGHMLNRIEVRTQFEGSSTKFLKNLRVIRLPYVLEHV